MKFDSFDITWNITSGFGSFEIIKDTDAYSRRAGPSSGDITLLQNLLNYTIDTHFPQIVTKEAPSKYYDFFSTVTDSTAKLVAHWQSVGFVHGVLNTDNMSILGLTIDYGPFGFLDSYDEEYTSNKSGMIF